MEENIEDIEKILETLEITREEFNNLEKTVWEERVRKAAEDQRGRTGDKNKLAKINKCQDFLLGKPEPNERQRFLAERQRRLDYKPLQTEAAEGSIRKNAIPVLAAQGDDASSLYTIKGDTPEEIAKNKKELLDKHKEFVGKYYDEKYGNLSEEQKAELPDAEKARAKDRNTFIAAFKHKDITFKNLADLEKSSDVSEEYKKTCKENYAGNFPMTVTVLPFPELDQGKAFMANIKENHIKPLPPAPKAKEEDKDKEEETALTQTTPLPGKAPNL